MVSKVASCLRWKQKKLNNFEIENDVFCGWFNIRLCLILNADYTVKAVHILETHWQNQTLFWELN